jgi:hypothetical protein
MVLVPFAETKGTRQSDEVADEKMTSKRNRPAAGQRRL